MTRTIITNAAIAIIGSAIIIAMAMLLLTVDTVRANAAPAPLAVTTPVCRGVEMLTTYYSPDESVVYGYQGDSALALLTALVSIKGPPAGKPVVLVFVGLDLMDGLSDFFLFDVEGCFVAHLGPAKIEFTMGVFDRAGIGMPFGRTYYGPPGIGL